MVNLVPNASKGIVSIFHMGEWGLMCDKFFSQVTGQVICKQLGFDAYKTHTTLGNVKGMEKQLERQNMLKMGSEIACKERGLYSG